MRRAIKLAREAAEAGEVPVGSVVADSSGIIAEAHNSREKWQDPTAHAELVAMRRAANEIGTWRLEECTVYVTLEPCPMCCGALINARVPELVYGATDPKAGCVDSLYKLTADERFNHTVRTRQSDLAEECGQLLTDFFRDVRSGDAPSKPGGEA